MQISVVFNDRTQGKGSQLHQKRFRPDIRKTFLYQEGDQTLEEVPREVVKAASLSVF